MSDNNKPGFLPDGTGTDGAAYGRDPATKRAYLRNGNVRKERTTKTVAETLAALAILENKASAKMGKDILAEVPDFAQFIEAEGRFGAWMREAKAHGSDEATAKRRAALEASLATLDAKQEAAEAFLGENEDHGNAASEVYATVGAAYIAFGKANKRAPNKDEAAAIIADAIDADAIAAVLKANDPENDPFLTFRRAKVENDTEGDDSL